MNNIVKVNCMHFWSDWTEMRDVEIDLDKYAFFSIEYRGIDSWHIVGYKYDKDYKWTTEELSEHQVSSVRDLADFIVYANAYPKSKGKFQDCKVSRFNNLHYGGNFYNELSRLLEMVSNKEQTERNKAIDEFAEKLIERIHTVPNKCIGGANVMEIAEQMKAGGNDGNK